MTKKKFILKKINRIKKDIQRSLLCNRYDEALCQISICANILYSTNITYKDRDLEGWIADISQTLKVNKFDDYAQYDGNEDILLFYDGIGINERGLAYIYLKTLCKIKKVIYVTYEDRKDIILNIRNIISGCGCEIEYINRRRKGKIHLIEQLNNIVTKYRPKFFFFYSVSDDVVAPSIMYAYKNFMVRYIINHTDYSFWLGAGCIDKCIEFRKYGAEISKEYRNVAEEKITIIPICPVIHRENDFQGYPFKVKEGQQIIFSTGDIYKTFSSDKKYYEIVSHVLKTNRNAIFWYAGIGDDVQMRKIIKKFPQQAYITSERTDLLQILERSRVYLCKYPMYEGVILQYAAKVGCVPLLFKNGNSLDDILIKQENIKIEYTNLKDLYNEINRLISDDRYAIDRGNLMKKSIINENVFEEEVYKIIDNVKSTKFICNFDHINMEPYRKWWLNNLSKNDLNQMYIRQVEKRSCIEHYPSEIIRSGYTYCLMDCPMVSVIVASYNPNIRKMWITLDSLICQKGIDFEIIIADDSSQNNYFTEIKNYFDVKGFNKYKLISHDKNQGTVLNIYDALLECNGRIVKVISPGDALTYDRVLEEWSLHLIKSGNGWSICDIINYRQIEGRLAPISLKANPQMIRPYIAKDRNRIRWNYVVLDDLATGAATLCLKEIMMEYIEKIAHKVIYAEDNIYRIMCFQGEVADYFCKSAVLYEVGEGVSTSGNTKWKKLLTKDWHVTDEIIREIVDKNDFVQRKLLSNMQKKDNKCRCMRIIGNITTKGKLYALVVKLVKPRMTSVKI